jgi:hypothetical protein
MASKEFYIKFFFSSKSSFDVRSQYQNNSYIHPFHIFFRTERPKTNFWFSKICYKKQFPDNKINPIYLPILHFAPKEKCFCSQSVTSWYFLNYLNKRLVNTPSPTFEPSKITKIGISECKTFKTFRWQEHCFPHIIKTFYYCSKFRKYSDTPSLRYDTYRKFFTQYYYFWYDTILHM